MGRGLSMRDLARQADLAVSFLSRIEAGKASPTVMSLVKILGALGLDVPSFFQGESDQETKPDPPPDQGPRVVFHRADMRLLGQRDRRWWYAFPGGAPWKADLTYEEYASPTRTREVERHGTDVMGYVIAGKLEIELPGAGVQTAKAGDAFYIPAGQAHVSRNAGPRAAKLVVVHLRPPAVAGAKPRRARKA